MGEKHISRINQPENRTVGWYVRIYYRGEQHGAFVSDKRYGGKKKALKLAKEIRDDWIRWRDVHFPLKKREYNNRFYYPDARNRTTGVVGVYRTFSNRFLCYSSTVVPEKGKTITKKFGINTFGEVRAFLLAADWRKQWMIKIHGNRFDIKKFDRSVSKHLNDIKRSFCVECGSPSDCIIRGEVFCYACLDKNDDKLLAFNDYDRGL